MAKVKPEPKLDSFSELLEQLKNLRSAIVEADIRLCRLMQRLATAEREARLGTWVELPENKGESK